MTASAESQSCGRMVTYYNKIAPLQEVIDNYLLTVCTTAIRSDRPEKVLRIITEFENKAEQTEAEYPTNPSLRHWEAAGASHVPFDAAANWAVPVERDTGTGHRRLHEANRSSPRFSGRSSSTSAPRTSTNGLKAARRRRSRREANT